MSDLVPGTRLRDAQVCVDRRAAPSTNNRLLPHNMVLGYDHAEGTDETILFIRELGGTFAADIILLDADVAAIAGASAVQVEELKKKGSQLGQDLAAANNKIEELEAHVDSLELDLEHLKTQLARLEAETLDWPSPEPE